MHLHFSKKKKKGYIYDKIERCLRLNFRLKMIQINKRNEPFDVFTY